MTYKRLIESAKQGTAVALSLCLLWTSGNIAQAAEVAPEVFASASNLPQFRLVPPGQYGRIADYFNAPTGDSKLVVLIQDLHAHYGVQKNTSDILDFLAKKLSKDRSTTVPFALAVEGAQGPVDSSVLALFPDQKIKAQAADYLMREGELTGAEHFAVMRGIPNLLVGVEDERYYNLNRELFRKTLSDRQELVSLLKSLETDIAPLQDRIYGQVLGDFQKKAGAYDKAEMSTHDFIGLLVQAAGDINIKRDFPTLASFSANSRFGTMEQIRAATSEFLTQTQGLLTAEEKADLKSLAKNGSTTPYYLYMRDLVYRKQLFLAIPTELAQYLEYIHTAQTMGMDRVTHEAKELAFQIKLRLAHQSQEKDLVQVLHDLDLLTRIADLQATEYEVKDFGPRMNQFVALCKSLMESNGIRSFDETKVRSMISSSVDYYAMALMRNKPMVDNTLALIGISGKITARKADHQLPRPATAVLVAGGFHTAPLTAILRQRNVSYIVITPMVENLTEGDHDLYVKRLNGDLLTIGDVLTDAKAWSSSTFAKVSETGHPADSLTPGTLGKAIGVGVIAAVIFGVAAHVTGHAPNLAYFDIFTHLPSVSAWANNFHQALGSVHDFLGGSVVAGGVAMGMMIPPGKVPKGEDIRRRLEGFDDVLDYLVRHKMIQVGADEAKKVLASYVMGEASLEEAEKSISRVGLISAKLVLDNDLPPLFMHALGRVLNRDNNLSDDRYAEYLADFRLAWNTTRNPNEPVDAVTLAWAQGLVRTARMAFEGTAKANNPPGDLPSRLRNREIVQLSNGSYLFLARNGQPVLIDPETLQHIVERHQATTDIAGSRIHAEEDIPSLIREVIEKTAGYGLQHLDFPQAIGTDSVVPIGVLEKTMGIDFSQAIEQGWVRVIPGQSTDRNVAGFNPRAGRYEVVFDRLPEEVRARVTAEPTNGLNVVLGSVPKSASAFPGADEVLKAWEVVQQEAGIQDVSQGIGIITAFPGKAAPKFPEDPRVRDENERREASAFWGNHVFVNYSPFKPGAAPVLTHPETYLAGYIRYHLGWWAYRLWNFFRNLHLTALQHRIERRTGLVVQRDANGELISSIAGQINSEMRAKIQENFAPRYEQRHFRSNRRATTFVISHGKSGITLQTQLRDAARIVSVTRRTAQRAFFMTLSLLWFVGLPLSLFAAPSHSDPSIFGSVWLNLLVGIVLPMGISAILGRWRGDLAGARSHSESNANHRDDGAVLTSDGAPTLSLQALAQIVPANTVKTMIGQGWTPEAIVTDLASGSSSRLVSSLKVSDTPQNRKALAQYLLWQWLMATHGVNEYGMSYDGIIAALEIMAPSLRGYAGAAREIEVKVRSLSGPTSTFTGNYGTAIKRWAEQTKVAATPATSGQSTASQQRAVPLAQPAAQQPTSAASQPSVTRQATPKNTTPRAATVADMQRAFEDFQKLLQEMADLKENGFGVNFYLKGVYEASHFARDMNQSFREVEAWRYKYNGYARSGKMSPQEFNQLRRELINLIDSFQGALAQRPLERARLNLFILRIADPADSQRYGVNPDRTDISRALNGLGSSQQGLINSIREALREEIPARIKMGDRARALADFQGAMRVIAEFQQIMVDRNGDALLAAAHQEDLILSYVHRHPGSSRAYAPMSELQSGFVEGLLKTFNEDLDQARLNFISGAMDQAIALVQAEIPKAQARDREKAGFFKRLAGTQTGSESTALEQVVRRLQSAKQNADGGLAELQAGFSGLADSGLKTNLTSILNNIAPQVDSAPTEPGNNRASTPRAMSPVGQFVTAVVTLFWYLNPKRAWSQIRSGWNLMFGKKAETLNPARYQAALARELKQLDPTAELRLEADVPGASVGGTFQTETAADGHAIYHVHVSAQGIADIEGEILLHELVHLVREHAGEHSRLVQKWGQWIGALIEEFTTVSTVSHLQEEDPNILAHTILPRASQAETSVEALALPDAAGESSTAQGLLAGIQNLTLRNAVLSLLRQKRKDIFTREAIAAAA